MAKEKESQGIKEGTGTCSVDKPRVTLQRSICIEEGAKSFMNDEISNGRE